MSHNIRRLLSDIQNMPWCKDQWNYSTASTDAIKLLTECANAAYNEMEISEEEIIEKSNAFPIPFPIETVRLEQLIKRKSLDKLRRNIRSTYPLIHERVLLLMANFLITKRQFGTNIEKQFYKDMSICGLIDRILKKRAVSFVGPYDKYLLLTGEEGASGWEEIGTSEEKPPLVLENCLSYDEMKLSAMVYVSGYTECINDGTRKNNGVINEAIAEDEAIIVGLIGPRFHRHERMDFEDILVTEKQNTVENGYGVITPSCYDVFKSTEKLDRINRKYKWRQVWMDFYQIEDRTYGINNDINKDAEKPFMEKHCKITSLKYMNPIFDNEVYYRRISVIADSTLVEANHRAKESSRSAFVNVIGCGLGVWMISGHQADVYVLTFLERISALLESRLLDHVSDVNFSYIKTGPEVMEIFSYTEGKNEQEGTEDPLLFLAHENHRNGGISVRVQSREPAARLAAPHADKLLVMTYPWDSNAHPGNEFWFGSLCTSGDPAAACSTQISELHNAHINPVVCASNTRVVGRYGLKTLSEYCQILATTSTVSE